MIAEICAGQLAVATNRLIISGTMVPDALFNGRDIAIID
jgi:hypothetical protein